MRRANEGHHVGAIPSPSPHPRFINAKYCRAPQVRDNATGPERGQDPDQVRKSCAQQRREIASLKRQVADLQRQRSRASRAVDQPSTSEDNTAKHRFSAKGLRSHRAKLGLSAGDYGRLAGVSGQSISGWESGKTAPRKSQIAALLEVRGLGKRGALARLEERDQEGARHSFLSSS